MMADRQVIIMQKQELSKRIDKLESYAVNPIHWFGFVTKENFRQTKLKHWQIQVVVKVKHEIVGDLDH
jgi:hypothetical protein